MRVLSFSLIQMKLAREIQSKSPWILQVTESFQKYAWDLQKAQAYILICKDCVMTRLVSEGWEDGDGSVVSTEGFARVPDQFAQALRNLLL